MQDRRRAEIELKRAKLMELRKAREDRKKADAMRPPAESVSSLGLRQKDVEGLVEGLLGASRSGSSSGFRRDSITGDTSPTSSVPGTPAPRSRNTLDVFSPEGSGRASRASDANAGYTFDRMSIGTGTTLQGGAEFMVAHERFVPEFVDVQQELFDLPKKERVVYNKEVQTAEMAIDASGPSEDEIRERIAREVDAERAARELDEEDAKLNKEIEEEMKEIQEMDDEARARVYAQPGFLDFIETWTKAFGRYINDYDHTIDYREGAETGPDDSEGKRVKKVCAFYDERWSKNRSITDVDWSPKFPELSAGAYNKNPQALNEPDGIVLVWNVHLVDRPEFVFHSQSDVLSVRFSPFHANLLFGGTYSGQILLWDTRAKHLPVLKSPLSAAGHTHPVYGMQVVGTQNAHNLISTSTDGLVCSWLVDMLAQPQESLELQLAAGANKTPEVAITCLDFPANETTSFWVGTEEGCVYQANRYDRAGAKAGLNQFDVYRGHTAPVTGLSFHPLMGSVDFSDLFLTCSVDWTVKLWRGRREVKPGAPQLASVAPIYSFDEADDYVYDVKWHPAHPAIFGSVNGSGRFDLWNLNVDTEVPTVSTSVGSGKAINKLQWDRKDGRRVALGSSDGRLYVYDIGDAAIPRESEWTDMQRTIAGIVAGQEGGVGGLGA